MRRFLVKQPLYLQDAIVRAEGVIFTDGHVVIFDLANAAITIYKNIEDFPDAMDDFYVEIEWIDSEESKGMIEGSSE